VAPINIVTPVGAFELLQGALLVGRLPECAVCLDDPLVSRMHLRFIVQGDCVLVEDLHSANGVYLNGVRVVSTAVLCEGDRLLIGTTEISLFEVRDASLTRLRAAPRFPGADAVSKPAPFRADAARPGMTLRLGDKAPAPVVDQMSRPPASFDRVAATARASALTMIGLLAERLASDGEVNEAVDVVSGQLRRILQGSNAGLAVPPEVAALAAHYALQVARWSGQTLWVDYVVELHLSARLLVASQTLEELARELSRVPTHDRLLFAYYVDAMRARAPQLSPEELLRVERLASLAGY
jgi:hypothetical protein